MYVYIYVIYYICVLYVRVINHLYTNTYHELIFKLYFPQNV